MTEYFVNHARRTRFPWSLYHDDISRRIASAVRSHGPSPHVLIVGCGLEPLVPGVEDAFCFACDIDARSIEACRQCQPAMAARLAVCPAPDVLPQDPGFEGPFDVVVAKEVVEHVSGPQAWARVVSRGLRIGGELVLSTPNYGRFSTLPLIESTILEALARLDGYSRREIHPSRFDRRTLALLNPSPDMELIDVSASFLGWALVGRWRRVR